MVTQTARTSLYGRFSDAPEWTRTTTPEGTGPQPAAYANSATGARNSDYTRLAADVKRKRHARDHSAFLSTVGSHHQAHQGTKGTSFPFVSLCPSWWISGSCVSQGGIGKPCGIGMPGGIGMLGVTTKPTKAPRGPASPSCLCVLRGGFLAPVSGKAA